MDDIIKLYHIIDTLFLLQTGVFLMLLLLGLALFQAGLLRVKSVTEILCKHLAVISVALLSFLLVGYNLIYVNVLDPSVDPSAYLPSFQWMLGQANALSGNVAQDHGNVLFANAFFQSFLAIICCQLVIGPSAERLRLWPVLLFIAILSGFIYPVASFWCLNHGFLFELGFFDYAGMGVLNLVGASCALACLILVGSRKTRYPEGKALNPMPASNVPLSFTGFFLIIMATVALNGGSQWSLSNLHEPNQVAQVYMNTLIAPLTGALFTLVVSRFLRGKADLTFAMNGALSSLVAISAGPNIAALEWVLLISVAAALVCLLILELLHKARLDDPTGVIAAFGGGALIGLVLLPLTHLQSSFTAQLIGIGILFAWSFVTCYLCLGLIKLVLGLRLTGEEQKYGADIIECGIEAYPEFKKAR